LASVLRAAIRWAAEIALSAMDVAALKVLTGDLADLISELIRHKEDTPDVLVNPILEKAKQCEETILGISADEKSGGAASVGIRAAELDAKVRDIAAMIVQLREQLEEMPWLDPPKLRKTRQTSDAISQAVADFERQVREARWAMMRVLGERDEPLHGLAHRHEPTAVLAPAMAGDAAAQSPSRQAGQPMDVDDALAMLLEKKPGGYRGGLVGIVHAAGVQEMVPFPAHSPAKFDFVFAGKSAAAFNLHQFSMMI